MLEGESFDMTLLLGPMYHLGTKEERMQAMAEAVRVTKPGGIIMAAYCIAEGSILKYAFGQQHVAELIGRGVLEPRGFTFRNQPEDIFVLLPEDGDRSDDAGLSCRTDALCGHRRAGVSDAGYAGTPD